jgi:hypothetical protein
MRHGRSAEQCVWVGSCRYFSRGRRRRRHTNPDAHCDSDSNTYCDCYGNSNRYSDGDSNRYVDAKQ